MLLPLAVALLLTQDKTDTFGKTNAQILAMGRSGWYRFYTADSRGGDSNVGIVDAERLYGDALAWRNDRLGKARISRLRKLLLDAKNDAVATGTAITGGGTIWSIVSAGLYADAEETLYAVLTKGGKIPPRKVSDVEKAYAKLKAGLTRGEPGVTSEKDARAALARLRRDLDGAIAEAARLPRRGSDAVLDFCIRAIEAGQGA